MTVLAFRGLRIGEAAGLKVKDLDLMRGKLTVARQLNEVEGVLHLGEPKTAAGSRVISLPSFVRDELVEHVAMFSSPSDPEAFVFTSPTGARLRSNTFRRRVFYCAAEAAGLGRFVKDAEGREHWDGPTVHDLRDVAATLSFSAGASVKEVQQLLGHANPSITLSRYAGVLGSMQARTDAALDAAFRKLEPNPAAQVRPFAASDVIPLPERKVEQGL